MANSGGLFGKIIIGVALLCFAYAAYAILPRRGRADGGAGEGAAVEDFTLMQASDETPWRLADHQGKVILLNFWATWCPPCRAEIPHLREIYSDYENADFVLVGVNAREPSGTVTQFIASEGIKYVVLLDPDGRVGDLYGVRGIPHNVLIGRDGTVAGVFRGYRPDLPDRLRAEIERLLADKPRDAGT